MTATLLLLGTALLSGVLSMFVTRRLIDLLAGARVLDVPNTRSLHQRSVPRGGGLAVVAVVVTTQLGLLASGAMPPVTGIVTVLVGAGFGMLGWADDRAGKPVSLRLAVQFVLAVGCVFALTGTAEGVSSPAGPWLVGALALGLVWHVNLFNFMDGADGLASVQAVWASVALAALFAAHGLWGFGIWAMALAGATAGFARWNWAPARIFLGDTGSYFIGFELALLALLGWLEGLAPWPFLIVMAPFITDASLTLLKRAVTLEPVWRAHRDHTYQHLVMSGVSPPRLAAWLSAYLLGVCWPAAWLARDESGWVPALMIYGLTGMIWAWMRIARFGSRPT